MSTQRLFKHSAFRKERDKFAEGKAEGEEDETVSIRR